MKKTLVYCLTFLVIISTVSVYGAPKKLTLAKDGKTDYVIVFNNQNPSDKRGAEDLRLFLGKATGADFKITAAKGKKNIIFDTAQVNDSYKITFKGNDIILQGNGINGRAYAVYELLERFGFRWYSAYGDMYIPEIKELSIETKPFSGVYAFEIRGSQTFYFRRTFMKDHKESSMLYHFRNRQNILLTELSGIRNEVLEYTPSTHVLSQYIHPGTNYHHRRLNKQLAWIPNKNYFGEHPEWFPMDKKGKRYPHGQLCFSNLQLQEELTKNALEQLKREIARTGRRDGIFSMSMNDIVYAEFCCCPECKAASVKYGQKGAGAYYKYLFEFCKKVKKLYPEVKISAFAYLSTLSMPEHLELPDNLIVIFCPIYSSYIASLEKEGGQRTLKTLKKWAGKNADLWYWYYTLPYSSGSYLTVPPMSNITRITEDLRLMKKMGIRGAYIEHDSKASDRTGFFELQSWLLLRLYRNPDENVTQLIREFTDFYYGKAAPLFRKYLYEVEKGCLNISTLKVRSVYNTMAYPYLTEDNLRRWQKMFDDMENLVKDDPKSLYHVKLARIAVDATYISITAKKENWAETEQRIDRLENDIRNLRKNYKYLFIMERITTWKKTLKKNILK